MIRGHASRGQRLTPSSFVLGWALVMSVVLSFIGLPLLIFGAALMQAQKS